MRMKTFAICGMAAAFAASGASAGQPVARWTMDADQVSGATVLDSSGNNINGTISGGVTAVAGKIGEALQFNGQNGFVQCGNQPQTALTGDLTFTAWVKTSGASAQGLIVRYEASGSESGYIIKVASDGSLGVRFGGDSNRTAQFLEIADATNKVNDGQWHFAAVVIRLGVYVQFFVDGGISSIQYVDSLPGGLTPSLAIGGQAVGAGYFNGAMDDVRIYGSALSSDEIAAIYGGPVATVPGGELLYNGCLLPRVFPPNRRPTQEPHVPSYIASPPLVIPIDVGRQFFVDDFLIAQTDLVRTAHRPVMYPGNPLLTADALPFSGGVWHDPADGLFKMWYSDLSYYCYAYSSDGLTWTKPSIPDALVPNTNKVIFQGDTMWLDLDATDPAKRFKAFTSEVGNYQLGVFNSPDGIHWTRWPHWGVTWGDRTTVFYNPFRKVWVDSMRMSAPMPAAATRAAYEPRARFYAESRDLVTWNQADPSRSYWTGPDTLDPPYSGPDGEPPELYNLDAVAYESLFVGMFSWFYPGLGYSDYTKPGPVLVELGVGFSRDGFDWVRPTRGFGNTAFIPASNQAGTWNGYNTQSVGGCFLVMGDELWFYFTGRNMKKPANGVCSTGLAKLRRDGFYSMDANSIEGALTTRTVKFSGKHMFVNVDDPGGALKVEVLDESGAPVAPFTKANCVAVTADKTRQAVAWLGASDLSAVAGRNVKFKFYLTDGSLYSFWVTPDASGASRGYVAAGGSGFTSAIDTSGAGSGTVAYGDADGNSRFELADLNVLVDWLLMRTTPPAAGAAKFTASDVNGDGLLGLQDLNLFVDKLLGRIAKFPVEP
jgi:hypothetical protein